MKNFSLSDNIDFFARWRDNDEAQKFFSYLESEESNTIFLTGKAGSGKSTLIQDVISFYKNENQFPVVLGSTGISALNIGGQTVHSFFSLGIDDIYFKDLQYYIRDKKQRKYKLKKAKIELLAQAPVVIIDEISMLSSNILDCIDFLMRFYLALHTKNKDLTKIPFGGKKMIFVGDVFQLPPVKTEKWIEKFKDKYVSEWFFDSIVFKKLIEKDLWRSVVLKKNYRQGNDKNFGEILDDIRSSSLNFEKLSLLNGQKKSVDDAILLSTHRSKVDLENMTKLNQLPGEEKVFLAETVGVFPDYMKRADDELVLKKGAKVMMLNNEPCGYRVNGSIGEVVGFDEGVIFVKINGSVYPIGQNSRENKEIDIDDDGKIHEENIGFFVQYPLKLAYAITIHKSQGMTFDTCKVDVSHVFSGGQVYTALSRVKSLKGLFLVENIKMRDLYFDDRIQDFVEKWI